MFRIYCVLFSFILASSCFGQREVTNINAYWEFRKQNDRQFSIVNLPHTFNAEDAFEDVKTYYRVKPFTVGYLIQKIVIRTFK